MSIQTQSVPRQVQLPRDWQPTFEELIANMDAKSCSRCMRIKPTSDFYRLKSGKPHSWCKACVLAEQKARRERDPERAREIVRRSEARPEARERKRASDKSRQEKDPTGARDRQRKWREANPGKAAEKQKRYRESHPEKVAEYRRRYNADGRSSEQYHKHRARAHCSEAFHVTRRDLDRLRSGACYHCGSVADIVMDHVVPLARGGTHGIGNLAPMCADCNGSKGAKTYMEWRLWLLKAGR